MFCCVRALVLCDVQSWRAYPCSSVALPREAGGPTKKRMSPRVRWYPAGRTKMGRKKFNRCQNKAKSGAIQQVSKREHIVPTALTCT